MYKTKQPKICLGQTGDYDGQSKTFPVTIIKTFCTKKELIAFLAGKHNQVYDAFGARPGLYANRYMQNQALTGAERSSEYRVDINSPELYWRGNYRVIYAHYGGLGDGWRIPDYLFWLDAPGRPNLDVRQYRKEVERKYLEYQQNPKQKYADALAEYRKKKKRRQGHAYHHAYRWRSDCHYIQRAKQGYWLLADEEEYRQLSKPKDRKFRSMWPSEDCIHGRRSSGWKDNPGAKHRKQWMAKAEREYRKIKKNIPA